MKFKRGIALAIISLMVLGCMTACKSREEASSGEKTVSTGNSKTDKLKAELDFGGETISFVYPPGYGMVDPEGKDPAIAKRNARIKEAEAKYHVKIQQREGRGNYWTAMATSIAAGNPDGHILVTQAKQFLGWMQANAFANLNDAMEKTGIDFTAKHYDQPTRVMTNFDNNQYGFFDVKAYPSGGSIWFFNKRIFKELNLEDPYSLIESKKWTWDKVEELAKKATKTSPDGTVQVYGLGAPYYSDLLTSMAVSNNSGIAQFDENGKPELKLAQPNAMAAFNKLYQWVVTDKMVRASDASENWDAVLKEFVNGRVAILCGGVNLFKFAQEAAMADEYGLIYPPLGPEAEDYRISSSMSEVYFIPKTYENMADKLLLLFDDIYAFRDGETVADKVADKYGADMKDAQSLKYYTDMVENISMRAIEISGLTDLEWTTPSLMELCKQVLVDGSATPGDALAKNQTQMQKTMEDAMMDNVFTGK